MYMTWRLSHRDTDFRFMIVVRFRTGLWCSRNVRYVWGPALGNSSWGGGGGARACRAHRPEVRRGRPNFDRAGSATSASAYGADSRPNPSFGGAILANARISKRNRYFAPDSEPELV